MCKQPLMPELNQRVFCGYGRDAPFAIRHGEMQPFNVLNVNAYCYTQRLRFTHTHTHAYTHPRIHLETLLMLIYTRSSDRLS